MNVFRRQWQQNCVDWQTERQPKTQWAPLSTIFHAFFCIQLLLLSPYGQPLQFLSRIVVVMKHMQPIYECLYNKHLFLKGRTLENSLYRVILTSLQWSFLRDSSSHLILTQLHAKISSITVTYLTADQRCMYNPRIQVQLRKPMVQSIMVRSRKPRFYFSCGICAITRRC